MSVGRRLQRLARAAIHVLGAMSIVLLAGAFVQALVEADQRNRFQPPGQMVELGDGRAIHLRIWGSQNQDPTLVLIASAGMFSSEWAWLGQDLGQDYRVVAVDRPGMGWSRGGSGPRHALAAAEAISTALQTAGIGPPYVVIGHSWGGVAARVFADLRRDDVIGLVLLDTTNAGRGDGDGYAILYRYSAWLGHTGLYQVAPLPPSELAGLPTGEAERAVAVSRWTSHLDATADELEAWDLSIEQVERAGSFGDLPLLVVRAYGPPEHIADQRDLLRLSSNSTYIELDNLGHTTMLTDQAQSGILISHLRPWLEGLTR